MAGMNAANVIIPGRGAIFLAAPSTAPLAYKTATPDVPGTAGWACLGHTSKDNSVALSKDGGEAQSYDSWWAAALAVVYDPTTWNVTVNALQIETGVLDLAFNGTIDTDGGYIVPAQVEAVDRAVFILAMQGTKRMGLYLPRVSITLGDAPSFDPSKMFEIPLTGAILADGDKVMKWYHPGLELQAASVVTAATPSAAVAGAVVTITGTGFNGTTGVKFGAVSATSFTVVSDTSLTAVMPAGTAGSSPITVLEGAFVSNAFTYTRGA